MDSIPVINFVSRRINLIGKIEMHATFLMLMLHIFMCNPNPIHSLDKGLQSLRM